SKSARRRYRPSNRKPPPAVRERSILLAHFSAGRESSDAAFALSQFPTQSRLLRKSPPISAARRCRQFPSTPLQACWSQDPSSDLVSLLRVPWWPPDCPRRCARRPNYSARRALLSLKCI